jgi:hypothetical protein
MLKMETEDLLIFPESDAPVYNYFTNEKELIETKQKVKDLEYKLKQFESRMKKVKDMEDKLKQFESRMMNLENENGGISIFPMLEKSNTGHGYEKISFYNINSETIRINSVYKLFIDDELFSSILEFTKKHCDDFLKQFKNVKYLIMDFTPQYNQENISCNGSLYKSVITKICR